MEDAAELVVEDAVQVSPRNKLNNYSNLPQYVAAEVLGENAEGVAPQCVVAVEDGAEVLVKNAVLPAPEQKKCFLEFAELKIAHLTRKKIQKGKFEIYFA